LTIIYFLEAFWAFKRAAALRTAAIFKSLRYLFFLRVFETVWRTFLSLPLNWDLVIILAGLFCPLVFLVVKVTFPSSMSTPTTFLWTSPLYLKEFLALRLHGSLEKAQSFLFMRKAELLRMQSHWRWDDMMIYVWVDSRRTSKQKSWLSLKLSRTRLTSSATRSNISAAARESLTTKLARSYVFKIRTNTWLQNTGWLSVSQTKILFASLRINQHMYKTPSLWSGKFKCWSLTWVWKLF